MIVKKFNYDLLITEVELDDGNAIDLIKSIKALPEDKLPSILVFV